MRSLSLEKTSQIKLIVLENKRFVIRQYEISFSMLTRSSEDLKEVDELQVEQNISFAKVMCFIDAILNDSIVITADNLSHYEKTLCEFTNNYVLVPDTIDNTIIGVLTSKFNAIVGDNTEVNSVTLYDLDDQLKYKLEIFEDDDDAGIVDIKEWLGELVLNNVPWWQRGDESTWDGIAKDREEYDKVKSSINDDEPDSIFEEIDDSIRSMYKLMKSENSDASAEVIEVDFQNETKKKKWKPKLV
jgi:hypothetical protein